MKFDPVFWYFFSKGIIPVIVFSLAGTGAYAIVRTTFGDVTGFCSLPIIAIFTLVGLYKTAQAVMK